MVIEEEHEHPTWLTDQLCKLKATLNLHCDVLLFQMSYCHKSVPKFAVGADLEVALVDLEGSHH